MSVVYREESQMYMLTRNSFFWLITVACALPKINGELNEATSYTVASSVDGSELVGSKWHGAESCRLSNTSILWRRRVLQVVQH